MPLLVKWQFQYTILINWQFFKVIKLRFWCSVQPNRNLIQLHCFLFTSHPKGRTLWFINMFDPLKKSGYLLKTPQKACNYPGSGGLYGILRGGLSIQIIYCNHLSFYKVTMVMLRGCQPSELHTGNTCLRIAQQTKPATWMNSLNEIDNNQK